MSARAVRRVLSPRRTVVPSVVALAALLLSLGAAARDPLLVTVGDVTSTTAVVWVRGVEEGPVSVTLSHAGGPPTTATMEVRRKGDLTSKLVPTGLVPGTRYAYRVASGGETAGGEFVTAPGYDRPARVRLLWSGDLGGGGFCRKVDGGYPIFRAMAARHPDFFLFVGDTIYADRPCDRGETVTGSDFVATTLAEFRAKHRYNREDAAVQEFFRLTSVYAIWDDHEVRNDFSGPSEPLMPAGRQAFLDYWPLRPPDDEPTRLYRKFRWGRLLEVFILDTRQYRSPNAEPDGPRKTMLGAAQRRWLIDNVAASGALWKVIVTSVPLSVPTGRPERRDSWSNANVFGTPQPRGTGFALERDAILARFRERGVKNIVFLAADVHHAELIRHQPTADFGFHEFIAGPLSATLGAPRPLDEGLNPRSLFARGGVNNFGELTVEPGSVTVRLIDEEDVILHAYAMRPE